MRLRHRLQAIYFSWFVAAVACTAGLYSAFQKDLLGVMALILGVFLNYTAVTIFIYAYTYSSNRKHPDIIEMEERHMDRWWSDPPII